MFYLTDYTMEKCSALIMEEMMQKGGVTAREGKTREKEISEREIKRNRN